MRKREREYFKFQKLCKELKAGQFVLQYDENGLQVCYSVRKCEECKKPVDPNTLTKCTNDEDEEYLCPDCLAKSIWYCHCCGQFSAGQNGFEFIHVGYCDNCWDEIEAMDYEGDRDEADYWDPDPDYPPCFD